MSLQSEAVKVAKSDTATFRVINTDALGFLWTWGRWTSVETCRLDRKALTIRFVIFYGSLVDIVSTGRVSILEVTHGVDVWSGGDHFSREGGERVAAGSWY